MSSPSAPVPQDPGGLQEELTRLIPTIRELAQWRTNGLVVLESEVHDLVTGRNDLVDEMNKLKGDVANLRNSLDAYDKDLKQKLEASERGLMGQDAATAKKLQDTKASLNLVMDDLAGTLRHNEGRITGLEKGHPRYERDASLGGEAICKRG